MAAIQCSWAGKSSLQTKSAKLEEAATPREDGGALPDPVPIVRGSGGLSVPSEQGGNAHAGKLTEGGTREKEGDHAKIVPRFCCAHQAQHSPPQSPSCERRFANCPAAAQEARSFLESNPTDHHPPLSQRTSTSYVEKKKSCNEAGC